MRYKNIDDYKFNEIKRTKYMIKQILFTLDWHSMYQNNFIENLESSSLKNSNRYECHDKCNTFLKAVQFNQYFVSLYNCFIVKLMRCFFRIKCIVCGSNEPSKLYNFNYNAAHINVYIC